MLIDPGVCFVYPDEDGVHCTLRYNITDQAMDPPVSPSVLFDAIEMSVKDAREKEARGKN